MKKNISPWGIKCKTQMIVLGKTLTDLSRETGLSRTYISAIINGRVAVPYETKHKISESLSVATDLIGTEQEMDDE
jgi:transcriptional regulator with XRE-family HTH domain